MALTFRVANSSASKPSKSKIWQEYTVSKVWSTDSRSNKKEYLGLIHNFIFIHVADEESPRYE